MRCFFLSLLCFEINHFTLYYLRDLLEYSDVIVYVKYLIVLLMIVFHISHYHIYHRLFYTFHTTCCICYVIGIILIKLSCYLFKKYSAVTYICVIHNRWHSLLKFTISQNYLYHTTLITPAHSLIFILFFSSLFRILTCRSQNVDRQHNKRLFSEEDRAGAGGGTPALLV